MPESSLGSVDTVFWAFFGGGLGVIGAAILLAAFRSRRVEKATENLTSAVPALQEAAAVGTSSEETQEKLKEVADALAKTLEALPAQDRLPAWLSLIGVALLLIAAVAADVVQLGA